MYKVLVIDDEKPIRDSLKGVLEDEGYEVYTAEDGTTGLRIVREIIPDVVLLDIWMPGKDGVEVLKEIKEELPQTQVIMMSGHGTIETAVKTTKIGAYDFIEKPISLDRLMLLVQNAIKYHRLLYENIYLKEQLKKDNIIIAESPKMKKLLGELNALIHSSVNVILIGEDGTGKKFLAKYLNNFDDKNGKFIEVNCLNQQHLKLNYLKEKVFLAKDGTLYVKNFKYLTNEARDLIFDNIKNFRLILSSTELDLDPNSPHVQLLHSINNVILNVPPLRERKEDIKPLLSHFSDLFADNYNKKITFSKQTLEILEKYSWPGNIKELKNFVEQMYITTKTSVVLHTDLPEYILLNCRLSTLQDELFHHNLLKEAKRIFEKEFIKHKLLETCGSIKKASEIMGVSEKNLRKLVKYFKLEEYVR